MTAQQYRDVGNAIKFEFPQLMDADGSWVSTMFVF